MEIVIYLQGSGEHENSHLEPDQKWLKPPCCWESCLGREHRARQAAGEGLQVHLPPCIIQRARDCLSQWDQPCKGTEPRVCHLNVFWKKTSENRHCNSFLLSLGSATTEKWSASGDSIGWICFCAQLYTHTSNSIWVVYTQHLALRSSHLASLVQ